VLSSNFRIAAPERFSTLPVLSSGHTLRCHLATALLGALCVLMVACSSVEPESAGTVPTPRENAAVPQENDQIGPNDAVLVWEPVSHPGLVGYRVYYSHESLKYLRTLGKVINVGDVTTHTIKGLVCGRRYNFAVTAYTSGAAAG
jgi:hypothetical protein